MTKEGSFPSKYVNTIAISSEKPIRTLAINEKKSLSATTFIALNKILWVGACGGMVEEEGEGRAGIFSLQV